MDFSPQPKVDSPELGKKEEGIGFESSGRSRLSSLIKLAWHLMQGLAVLRSFTPGSARAAAAVETVQQPRRSFWSTNGGKVVCVAAGSLAIAGVGALMYATRVETKRFGIESIDVTTGDGKQGLEDAGEARTLKILHLSDLHLMGEDYEKAAFLREVTSQEYDIVVLTGDIFQKYSGIKFAASLLARQPRLGAFAVLGNHDYYQYSMFNKIIGRIVRKFRTPPERRNVTPMVSALREVGFSVLQNQATSCHDHKLHVVGIDWPSIEEDVLLKLVSDVPDDYFSLCLFHLPKNLNSISKAGVDLAVGGHTHGGQVRVPGFGAIITDSELSRHEASGLIWRGKTAFHISRGLGADPRSNIRFFCPPAVTVLNVLHARSKTEPR
jgi:predicted MPP superfamily phosphohydrolase